MRCTIGLVLAGALAVSVPTTILAEDLPPLVNVLAMPAGMTPPKVPRGQFHSAAGFYPKHAADCAEGGRVIVEATIGTDGSVTNVQLMESSGFADLDVDGMVAVGTWRYEPATRDGNPVAVRERVAVQYGATAHVSGTADCSPEGTKAAADTLLAALRGG